MISTLILFLAIAGFVSSQSVQPGFKNFRESLQLIVGLSRNADCQCEEMNCRCITAGHPALGHIGMSVNEDAGEAELDMQTGSSEIFRQKITLLSPEVYYCLDFVPGKYGFCITVINANILVYPIIGSACLMFDLNIGGVHYDIPFLKICIPPLIGKIPVLVPTK